MSLVGNLEDLSLPDILQIVSLSKKSGVLTLEREEIQGRIFIRDGKVIQTISPRSGKTLGEILSSKGLISAQDLQKALEVQKTEDAKELLGNIMVRLGMIDQDTLEKVVREQIEEAIVYFLSWKEGTFNFQLSSIQGRGEVSVDPHAFILEKGIDTQWLVLEGTRMMDERSEAAGGGGTPIEETVADAFVEEDTTAPAEPAEAPSAGTRGGVVLVDDDPIFRDQAGERLRRLDYQVVGCDGTEEGLKVVQDFPRDTPPVVITDIVFPTSDGRGFLGGLELIEKLRRSMPEVPIIAITAYPDDNVRNKVAEFGVSKFIIKPAGIEGADEAKKEEFFTSLTEALAGAREESVVPPETEEAPDMSEREMLVESLEEGPPPSAAAAEEAAPQPGLDRNEFALLQEMMQELQNPKASSEIGLLILRFASEMLNRAVLFVIKGGNAVGLGGFGVDVSTGGRKGGVRGIAIPLDQPSVLEEVVRRKASYRGPVAHTPANVQLMQELGGSTPAEAVVLPLVAGGKVRVVLYGDNLPDDGPLPSMQAMDIFLTQAGMTLERVLLEKKLQESGRKND